MIRMTNEKKRSRERYVVPAVEQASRVLFGLAGARSPHMSLTEICAQVGIHKSKAFSILHTLQKFGLVQRNTNGKLRNKREIATSATLFESALLSPLLTVHTGRQLPPSFPRQSSTNCFNRKNYISMESQGPLTVKDLRRSLPRSGGMALPLTLKK